MIFETHAHYDDDRFDEDRDTLLRDLPKAGVEVVINSGASVESTRDTVLLAQKYPHVYAAVGVHPSEIGEMDEDFLEWMKEQTSWEKTVAIGEIVCASVGGTLLYYSAKKAFSQAKRSL